MLAALLPGVRDLRTPLAVGYTLLLAAWLLYGDAIPSREQATGVVASLYGLVDLVGPGASLAALSFVVYLVGSVVLVSKSPFRLGTLRRPSDVEGADYNDWTDSTYVTPAQLRGRTGEASLHAILPEAIVRDLEHHSAEDRERELSDYLRNRIEMETRTAVSRLQVKSPPLYDAYDRLMAEAELRLSLFAPLLLLTGVLAVKWDPWALALIILPFVLSFQGGRREMEARRLLTEAYRDGLVESATMERLNAWLKNKPNEN